MCAHFKNYMHIITDVDECSTGTDNCAAEATCTDTDGSYTCTCNTGYAGDGTDCLSKNFISILFEYSWFGNFIVMVDKCVSTLTTICT